MMENISDHFSLVKVIGSELDDLVSITGRGVQLLPSTLRLTAARFILPRI
jgi:hypothetical protein